MDRIVAPPDFALAGAANLAALPKRRWSDGPNYPWSIAMEGDWSVDAHWPALVAVLCEQVARGTEAIGQRMQAYEEEGAFGRADADAIAASAQSMRSASTALQQIVRLGAGGSCAVPENIDLARVARRIAHERLREFLRRGVEVSFDIRAAQALVDGSVADSVMNVALDWALSFSRRVRFKVGALEGSHGVHLIVRATLPRPSEAIARGAMPRADRRMNDNLHWILLRQLAACSQLPITRSSTAATESAVIQLPVRAKSSRD